MSKEGIFYIIKNIRREKMLDISSNYIANIIDREGEDMGYKYLTDMQSYFNKGEWIKLN